MKGIGRYLVYFCLFVMAIGLISCSKEGEVVKVYYPNGDYQLCRLRMVDSILYKNCERYNKDSILILRVQSIGPYTYAKTYDSKGNLQTEVALTDSIGQGWQTVYDTTGRILHRSYLRNGKEVVRHEYMLFESDSAITEIRAYITDETEKEFDGIMFKHIETGELLEKMSMYYKVKADRDTIMLGEEYVAEFIVYPKVFGSFSPDTVFADTTLFHEGEVDTEAGFVFKDSANIDTIGIRNGRFTIRQTPKTWGRHVIEGMYYEFVLPNNPDSSLRVLPTAVFHDYFVKKHDITVPSPSVKLEGEK